MKIKKILSTAIAGYVFAAISTAAFAIDVYVDTDFTRLTDANGNTVEPFIQNGTTYVPLRGISQALGCQVEWDGNNRVIKIYQNKPSNDSVFHNSDDNIKVYIDDEEIELKDANGTTVKPFIIDGTTFIPLRGVSQALGCQVEWDGALQRVSIYQNTVSPNGATLSEVKPYELDCLETFYELDANTIKIDNNDYSNALGNIYDNWGEGYALLNLNSKYKNLTATVGATDRFGEEKQIVFIVDGEIVKTIYIDANSSAQDISVPLNYGLQLKIVFKGRCTGMGNIVFH